VTSRKTIQIYISLTEKGIPPEAIAVSMPDLYEFPLQCLTILAESRVRSLQGRQGDSSTATKTTRRSCERSSIENQPKQEENSCQSSRRRSFEQAGSRELKGPASPTIFSNTPRTCPSRALYLTVATVLIAPWTIAIVNDKSEFV
jgi:hypothetical protein